MIELNFENQKKSVLNTIIGYTPVFIQYVSTAPILNLPPIKWNFSANKNIFQQTTKLGDNYSQTAITPDSMRKNYDIAIPRLNTQSKDEIVTLFKQYGGFTRFRWRPLDTFDYKEFICDKWSVTNQGINIWEITATFTEQLTPGIQEKTLFFENQNKNKLWPFFFPVLFELNFENQKKSAL